MAKILERTQTGEALIPVQSNKAATTTSKVASEKPVKQNKKPGVKHQSSKSFGGKKDNDNYIKFSLADDVITEFTVDGQPRLAGITQVGARWIGAYFTECSYFLVQTLQFGLTYQSLLDDMLRSLARDGRIILPGFKVFTIIDMLDAVILWKRQGRPSFFISLSVDYICQVYCVPRPKLNYNDLRQRVSKKLNIELDQLSETDIRSLSISDLAALSHVLTTSMAKTNKGGHHEV